MTRHLILGLIYVHWAQILAPNSFFFFKPGVRNCSKLSFYAIYRKTNEQNSRKWRIANFRPEFDPFRPNLGP